MSQIAKMHGSDFECRTRHSYFKWLCSLVCLDDFQRESYFGLAEILHDVEFYHSIPLDYNREADAFRLRTLWIDIIKNEAITYGIEHVPNIEQCLTGPCSFLEILIALAKRLETDVMQSDDIGPRTAIWFWRMLDNLRFTSFSDNHPINTLFIRDGIQTVLDRTYDYFGNGGLFPLMHPEQDQRGVEIWWQAQAWLKENYFAGGSD